MKRQNSCQENSLSATYFELQESDWARGKEKLMMDRIPGFIQCPETTLETFIGPQAPQAQRWCCALPFELGWGRPRTAVGNFLTEYLASMRTLLSTCLGYVTAGLTSHRGSPKWNISQCLGTWQGNAMEGKVLYVYNGRLNGTNSRILPKHQW